MYSVITGTFLLNWLETHKNFKRMKFCQFAPFLIPPQVAHVFPPLKMAFTNFCSGSLMGTFLQNYFGIRQADSGKKNFRVMAFSPLLMPQQPKLCIEFISLNICLPCLSTKQYCLEKICRGVLKEHLYTFILKSEQHFHNNRFFVF